MVTKEEAMKELARRELERRSAINSSADPAQTPKYTGLTAAMFGQDVPEPIKAMGSFASGGNSLIPAILGLPVDTATNLANLGIAGYGALKGLLPRNRNAAGVADAPDLPDTLGPQFLGSQSIKGMFESAIGSPIMSPQGSDSLNQNLHMMGGITTSGLLAPSQSAQQALRNVASMVPSAIGAVGMKEAFPDQPLAPAMGALVTPAAIPLAQKAAGLAGKAASHAVGATTGAGSEAVKQAFLAGKQSSKIFLDNLRNKAPMDEVLSSAKEALTNMKQAASLRYKTGMVDISSDKTILSFKPIQDAMNKQAKIGTYKGQTLNKSAGDTIGAMNERISEWSKLNPAEYHTPEGLDALKKAIGDIRDTTQYGTPSRVAANGVYNAIKNQINKQAPAYSRVMKNYSESQETISQIERALSLGEKASADTALRKLQSLMRNNVNTNYSNRLKLSAQLETQGGADIMPALAGQSLNSPIPRGLMGAVGAGGGTLAAITHPETWPGLAAAAPFFSPRLMGEAAYGLGASSRLFGGGVPINQTGAALPASLINLINLQDSERER